MLELTPLATKDYFEMPEYIRRREYFPNWHKYFMARVDKALVKADVKIKELDNTLARMKAKRLAGTHTLGYTKRRKTMLTIQRPNTKKTGAVLEVMPSTGCAIEIKLYQQKMVDQLAYDEPISATLFYEDMALILMVIQGWEESVLNGKGIYHQYRHETVRILFRHIIDSDCGSYELEIIDTKTDGSETKRARIMLQTQDALALSYGIQGVLSSSLTSRY